LRHLAGWWLPKSSRENWVRTAQKKVLGEVGKGHRRSPMQDGTLFNSNENWRRSRSEDGIRSRSFPTLSP
jgi:hypothetical protein